MLFNMAELVGRRSADEGLLVNDAAGAAGVEIRQVDDAAVDDGDADSGARLAVAVGPVGVNRTIGDGIEHGFERPVGRDVGDVGIIEQGLQLGARNGVVHGLDEIHLGMKLSAEGRYFPAMRLGGNNLVLHDHIDGGGRFASRVICIGHFAPQFGGELVFGRRCRGGESGGDAAKKNDPECLCHSVFIWQFCSDMGMPCTES